MLIGTAGHIDHGKTTLVKALTGVDADRLPEEKARGITLDLGYAYWPQPDGQVIGFIDVPGHERLIHNMLAGATGIDDVLLVIAADDGPMPQTREHLALLGLLGLDHGTVVLTKCDRVDADRLAAVRADVARLLAGTGLAGAPVFEVSATRGGGIAALATHLRTRAADAVAREAGGGFRLAIDRRFTLDGIGTVVTGTAFSGRVRVGDSLILSPTGQPVRVRSLHVQDRPAELGRAGDRCALALAGAIERADIRRGMWVLSPPLHRPIGRFHAELRVPEGHGPFKHWSAVHLHLGADDLTARVALLDCDVVAPGDTSLAELIVDRPLPTVRGDRFVLRDAGGRRTVAGGRVLDVFPPARHKRSAQRLAVLAALRDDDPAVALEAMLAGAAHGIDLGRFAGNWNLDDARATALWRRPALHVIGEGDAALGFAAAAWQALGARMIEALSREHERAPDMLGVERERLRRMTSAALSRAAFDALLADALARGEIEQTRSWLHRPGHRVSVAPADRDLFASLRPLLDASPFNPPRVRDVFRATGVAEDTVRQLFRRLSRAGELYPVAHDHYFSADAVARLAEIVARLAAEHGTARAADFRDAIGGGRKVAIQILEFFDRVGYTRRVRDDHLPRGAIGAARWSR